MNTLTTASILPGRTAHDLAAWTRTIGRAMFAMSLAALESWLRFPIRPLFDHFLHSSMSCISSVAAAVFHHFSL